MGYCAEGLHFSAFIYRCIRSSTSQIQSTAESINNNEQPKWSVKWQFSNMIYMLHCSTTASVKINVSIAMIVWSWSCLGLTQIKLTLFSWIQILPHFTCKTDHDSRACTSNLSNMYLAIDIVHLLSASFLAAYLLDLHSSLKQTLPRPVFDLCMPIEVWYLPYYFLYTQ